MGKCDDGKCVFSLTSLQIGDLQSYLSDLSLFLALESKRLYILVDNRPWLTNPGTKPTHLWQLMVTKSRLSPFANTKYRRDMKMEKQVSSDPKGIETEKLRKWFHLINAAALSRKRIDIKKLQSSLFLYKELHKILYGFIVFEVAWSNVRGINYLNELQTDTSLAVEAKLMRRWEFKSVDQAAKTMFLWFSGTKSEKYALKEYLDTAKGEVFYDARESFGKTVNSDDDDDDKWNDDLDTKESPQSYRSCFDVYPPMMMGGGMSEPHTPPLTGPYKRRRVTKSTNTGVEVDVYLEETHNEAKDPSDYYENNCHACENAVEPTQYKDVLILIRFNDCDLPFKLREIIMSDLRLLTLLEAGLPSWVIFLQSYPGFCHLYRPWMCPLARALYVLISLTTVIIGFYDLYKNVPLLKATASRLCGPLFDWIETWDMVSRIKYLGTMLFLHNFQKAVRWTLTMTRATQSFFSVLIMPLAQPVMYVVETFLPFWNLLTGVVESFFSIIWIAIDSSFNLIGDVVEMILLPIWFVISMIWNIAFSVLYPVFWVLWEVLYFPIRFVLMLVNFASLCSSYLFDVLGDFWRSASGVFQLASESEAAVRSSEVSMWRSLWNDLFSQIFRAVRSILNGFVAFFAACNRHRLSIYNHIRDFIHRLLGKTPRPETTDSRRGSNEWDHHFQAEARRNVY